MAETINNNGENFQVGSQAKIKPLFPRPRFRVMSEEEEAGIHTPGQPEIPRFDPTTATDEEREIYEMLAKIVRGQYLGATNPESNQRGGTHIERE